MAFKRSSIIFVRVANAERLGELVDMSSGVIVIVVGILCRSLLNFVNWHHEP